MGLYVLLSLFSTSCENEEIVKPNQDLIFPNAKEIKIPAYSYQSGPDNIFVQGDAGFITGIADTVTANPVLRWDSVQTTHIVAAIFKQPVLMINGAVTNTDDIVWIWHTGLGTGKNGHVEYIHGKSISNGDIYNETDLIHLVGPGNYYWGVWGWNNSGTVVAYSSRALVFFIK